MERRIGQGRIIAECRSDGCSVASDLFATYPCRLHLTSRPNNEISRIHFVSDDESNNEINDKNDHTTYSVSKALSCYVLGYGGGLISGDSINLDITVKPKASLVVTSQSTSKAFKAIPDRDATLVQTSATVGKKSLLFLVPQPMQCFGGSKLEQQTHVLLDGSTNTVNKDEPSLLLVDWYTGGRKNMDGGLWNMESFHSTTTISYSNRKLFSNENLQEEERKCHNESDFDDLVFRDATRLSGGYDLLRHMSHFNIVCMVVLIGPRVKKVANLFLDKYSSRHIYDESHHLESNGMETYDKGRGLNQNKGEGLNKSDEGLLVSCGTFSTSKGSKQRENGVVVRLAADSLEIAATFLSRHIGTLSGQLEDDPFLEILASKQCIIGQQIPVSKEHPRETKKNGFPITLLSKSFAKTSKHRKSDSSKEEIAVKPQGIGSISPLLLYQLVDSCVPSGGFAHSNTLEAAHQLHLLTIHHSSWKLSLREHCFDVLIQSFTSIVPFLIETCELFRNHYHSNHDDDDQVQTNTGKIVLQPPSENILELWENFDNELRATMNSHVACRASTTQGSGMLRAFSSAFPHISPVIKVLRRHIIKMTPIQSLQSDCFGHAATCFGAVCGLLDINHETCVSMFLYTTARDMVNAAVRMNLIGPLEGGCVTNELCIGIDHLIQHNLSNMIEQSCEKNVNIEQHTYLFNKFGSRIRHSHQVAPLIEVLSNAHDRLYTRLFNS